MSWDTAEVQVRSLGWFSGLRAPELPQLQFGFSPWPGNLLYATDVATEFKYNNNKRIVAKSHFVLFFSISLSYKKLFKPKD